MIAQIGSGTHDNKMGRGVKIFTLLSIVYAACPCSSSTWAEAVLLRGSLSDISSFILRKESQSGGKRFLCRKKKEKRSGLGSHSVFRTLTTGVIKLFNYTNLQAFEPATNTQKKQINAPHTHTRKSLNRQDSHWDRDEADLPLQSAPPLRTGRGAATALKACCLHPNTKTIQVNVKNKKNLPHFNITL